MTIYSVIRKADQVEVYRYEAPTPIEWVGFEFATHDHVELAEPGEGEQGYTGSWIITRLAFRNRFTQAEKIAIEIAALDVPTAPMPQRAQAAALRAYLSDVAAATFIDLRRTDTRTGVQTLEAAGLLGSGRAAAIFDTPPTEQEVYRG